MSMACSAQPSWEPLPLAVQPSWQSLAEAGDLQPSMMQDMELPPLQPDWAPSLFGQTLPALPPLPALPLAPLPAMDEQLLLSIAAPAALESQLLPSSSGSDMSAKLEDRMQRMRAKNRRAQARYRDKQKAQRQQVELQYAAVAAELEETRMLNAELRAAVAVQEAVRENRETVEAILQAAASQQSAGQRRCDDAGTCDAEGAAACWQLQPFQQRVALYAQVGRTCEPMRQLLEHCSTGSEPVALEPSTNRELRQRMAQSMPDLVANVQSTTVADLMQEWAAFCQFADEVASAVDSGRLGQEEGEERVRPAMEYIAAVKQLMLMHNSDTYRQMLLRTRLPGETDDAATARWRQAALASGITRKQAEGMLPHYQLYLRRQAELGAELGSGMAALQRASQELAGGQVQLQGTLRGMAAQYVSLFEAGGAVEHQTHSATLILHDFMCSSGRLLTPLQKARVVRYCVSNAGSGQPVSVYPDLVSITKAMLDHHSLLPPQPDA